MAWLQAALLVVTALGKGGNLGSLFESRRRVVVSYSTALNGGYQYAPTVLLHAGTRRRYGVYSDSSPGTCSMLPDWEMRNVCANLMQDESQCFMCLACETMSCVESIPNCEEYISEAYYECCEENCGYDWAQMVFNILLTLCVAACLLFYCWVELKKLIERNSTVQPVDEAPPPPVHPIPHAPQGLERVGLLWGR